MSPYNDAKLYAFTITECDEKTFEVVSFRGTEAISALFSYTVILLSKSNFTNFDQFINKSATLKFLRKDNAIETNGIISRFEFLQVQNKHYVYQVHLRPRLWRLKHLQSSVLFLEKTTGEIITEVLDNANLKSGTDFEVSGGADETAWDQICMFNESPLGFISHRMERNGFYYYFKHANGNDMLQIINQKDSQQPLPGKNSFRFDHPWVTLDNEDDERVHSFHLRQKALPNNVLVRDYNYDKADQYISGKVFVDKNKGFGQVYFYGEHARTDSEAKQLAKVRSEELLCQQNKYKGFSSVRAMRSGYTFTLQNHELQDFNREYLITEVRHEGQQTGFLHGLFGVNFANFTKSPIYNNTFTCIPSDTQFRARSSTPKKRFHGLISAVVDGSMGEGKPALDEDGRYNVILPFDLSGRNEGKASCPVRLLHPYAGKNVTFHFPLLKGTEVLVAFVGGDPDRPAIVGAVHNSESPSIVTSESPYMNTMQTASKQLFLISDTPDNESIMYGSTEKQSILKESSSSSALFSTKSECVGSKYSFMWGNSDSLTVGSKVSALIGTSLSLNMAPDYKLKYGPTYDIQVASSKSSREAVYNSYLAKMDPSTWLANKFGMSAQPMNVKYSNQDTFEFGDGSTFTAKKSKSSLGLEKSTMYGGAPEVLDSPLEAAAKSVETAMLMAGISGLAQGLGGGLLDNFNPLGMDKKNTYHNVITNGLSTVVAAAVPALAACHVNKSLATIFSKAKDVIEKKYLIGGMVQCTKNGVEIRANNPVIAARLNDAQIKLHTVAHTGTGAPIRGKEASIVLAPKGESITLERGTNGTSLSTLTMQRDSLEITGKKSAKTSALSLNSTNFTVDINSKNTLKVTEKALLSSFQNRTNFIEQSTKGIKLQAKKSELNITQQHLRFRYSTNEITFSSTGLNAKGTKIAITSNLLELC